MKIGRLVILWWDDWHPPGARRLSPNNGLGWVYVWNVWAGPLEIRWCRAARNSGGGRG